MAVGTLSGALVCCRPKETRLSVSVDGSRCLRARLYSGRTGAWILVVCGRSRGHRRGCPDLHQRHEQHHAALDRTSDAGQGDGAPGWRCTGGNDRSALRSSVGLPTTSALAGRSEWAPGRASPLPWSQSTFWPAEKNHCSRSNQSSTGTQRSGLTGPGLAGGEDHSAGRRGILWGRTDEVVCGLRSRPCVGSGEERPAQGGGRAAPLSSFDRGVAGSLPGPS